MTDAYAVYVEGLSALDEIEHLPDYVKMSAHRAVIHATKRARTESGRLMRERISWSATYLTGQGGKLEINLPNRDGPLEGDISAKFRPTSLARFAVGSKTPWKPGVSLHVGQATYRTSKRMFIVPLRKGNFDISEDRRNLGLAIRLKDGEVLQGKYKMREFSKGLYLLSGPSVAQVFYSVAEDVKSNAAEWLRDEFERQMKLPRMIANV